MQLKKLVPGYENVVNVLCKVVETIIVYKNILKFFLAYFIIYVYFILISMTNDTILTNCCA